ncbi:MAG: hypothetical protein WBV85_07605 [Solirubrobacteraceae bacterium]
MIARKRIAAVLAVLFATVGVSALFGPSTFAAEYLPSGTFGSEGSGDGQFEAPAGVAVNEVAVGALGDVYVIDTGNERIERFDFEGKYLSQWDGSATAAGSFSFYGLRENSQGIAVDNSRELLDSAAGDVYVADARNKVVDQFTAEGAATGLEIRGTCPQAGQCAAAEVIPFSGFITGVAVDPKGNLWVSEEGKNVDEFSDAGVFEQSIKLSEFVGPGLSVDSSDDLYVVGSNSRVDKYPAGSGSAALEFGQPGYALAVMAGTNEVLVDQGSRIALYGPFAEPAGAAPLQVFPSEGLSGGASSGLAIDAGSDSKTVYASELGVDQVAVFDSVKFPEPTTEQPSEIGETSATLHGTVDTEGKEVTDCHFEYEVEPVFGAEPFYGEQLPCKQTPAEINVLSKGGTEPVTISSELSGLSARKNYHYRLSVSDSTDTRIGSGVALYTFSVPSIEGEKASKVTSVGATVSASVSAGGVQTSYRVEYGPSGSYGSSTKEVGVGAPEYPVSVLVPLSGLTPSVEYHFRVVATNVLGVSDGPDSTFVTGGAAGLTASILPDGRVDELVSSTSGSQSVYNPFTAENTSEDLFGVFGHDRAAADGDSVTYMGEPLAEGGNGSFGLGQTNQLMAIRSATGWTTQDITPTGTDAHTRYEFFSSDLSIGVLGSAVPVDSNPPMLRPGCPVGLYARSSQDGSYQALYSEVGAQGECGYGSAFPVGGMSADGLRILLRSSAALTPGSVPGDKVHPNSSEENNLYISANGELHQINVLPNGESEQSPDAFFGGPSLEGSLDPSNVISSAGSRVFWTSSDNTKEEQVPKALYVRENGTMPQSPLGPGGECTDSSDACTVQIDAGEHACVVAGKCEGGGGRFWGASADGSRVFFTDCAKLTVDSTAVPTAGCTRSMRRVEEPVRGNDLYEYDVETGKLTDLTVDDNGDPLGADVQGVLGTSESGDYVYFVADGVLAAGAKQRSCQRAENNELEEEEQGFVPTHHGCNLYVWHEGQTSFVGVLLYADNQFIMPDNLRLGDWLVSLGERTAEVSPDGHDLVFTSTSRLTGYDNAGLGEIFVYDASSGKLACASCNPSGAPPSVGPISPRAIAALLPVTESAFMDRVLSGDGSRVFFETKQPLVAQDANGMQDVYEWERAGVGSCRATTSKGCIYLLSGGESSANAYLMDADVTGENVFFTSREKLVPQADGRIALYDARIDGGFPEVATECTGTGCQGVPPAPPIFATPSSATFNGVGNFSPPAAKPAAKPSTKRALRCKRGFVKRGGRCVRKTRSAERSAKRPSARTRKRGGR